MNGLMDFVFPYLIQFLKEYTGKVDNSVEGEKGAARGRRGRRIGQEATGSTDQRLPPAHAPGTAGAPRYVLPHCCVLHHVFKPATGEYMAGTGVRCG